MKRVVMSLLLMGSLIGVAGAAPAQDKVRIGVVDVRKVMLESEPGKRFRTELEKMMQDERSKLTKEDESLKKLQEQYEKDKLTMTDKQKQEKQKQIEEKAGSLRKAAQEAQQRVAKRDTELSGGATKIVQEAISDVARQEKLAMVIDKNQNGIYWVDDPVDITDRVIKAYEVKAKK